MPSTRSRLRRTGTCWPRAFNGLVKTWNVSQELGQEDTLRAHLEGIGPLAFTPDGAVLATGGKYGGVKLWQVASGREIGTLEPGTEPAVELGTKLRLATTEVKAIAFSPDRVRLAVTGQVGTRILNLQTYQWNKATKKWPAKCSVFAPDGARLLVGGQMGVIAIEMSNRQPHSFSMRHAEAIAVSRDGRSWRRRGDRKDRVRAALGCGMQLRAPSMRASGAQAGCVRSCVGPRDAPRLGRL